MAFGEQNTSPSEVIQTVFEHLNERDADVVRRFGAEDEVSHWPLVGRPAAVVELDGGHACLLESPEEFIAALVSHVDGDPRGSSTSSG